MRMPARSTLSVAASLLLAVGAAQANVIWDEAIHGDFSNDGLAPTVLSLGAGNNVVHGTTGRPTSFEDPVDRDYFTFTVPVGYTLDALTLLPGSLPVHISSFIGMEAGNQVTVSPDAFMADGLLGWMLFREEDIGTNLLETMSVPDLGSTGFTLPLPAGDYAFWVQETAVGTAFYSFDFSVSAVPELPTVAGMLAGLTLLGAALRRRRYTA